MINKTKTSIHIKKKKRWAPQKYPMIWNHSKKVPKSMQWIFSNFILFETFRIVFKFSQIFWNTTESVIFTLACWLFENHLKFTSITDCTIVEHFGTQQPVKLKALLQIIIYTKNSFASLLELLVTDYCWSI